MFKGTSVEDEETSDSHILLPVMDEY